MKKLVLSLVTVAFAATTAQAYAQASSSNAVEERTPNTAQHGKKSLKTHGKRAGVSTAASAAGTSDKGTQN